MNEPIIEKSVIEQIKNVLYNYGLIVKHKTVKIFTNDTENQNFAGVELQVSDKASFTL